jgi:uncharacterized membrane protein
MRSITLVGPRRPYDLLLVSAIAVFTVILSQLKVESPVRWVIALFSIYFAPGYAIVSMLFPGKRSLLVGRFLKRQEVRSPHVSLLDRIALSFLFSIVAVAIPGTILSRGLYDLTATSVELEVLIITVGASLMALYFRSRLAPDDNFTLTLTVGRDRAALTIGEKVIAALIVGSLLITVVAVVNGFSGQGTKEAYTEFYLTGPDGTLSSLPASVFTGENVSVNIKVTNRMNLEQSYNLTIGIKNGSDFEELVPLTWTGTHSIGNGTGYYSGIELKNGETFEQQFIFRITASSGEYRLLFLLNDNGQEKLLWLRLEVRTFI